MRSVSVVIYGVNGMRSVSVVVISSVNGMRSVSVVVISIVNINRIGGVMVSVLVLSVVDRGCEPRSGQTKDYEIKYLLLFC